MARTGASALKAGLLAVLAGGQVYWMCIIRPNVGDSWDPIAFGNLAAYSLAGYTVWTNRLIEIGDIDISFNKNVIEEPMALIQDTEIQLQNVDGSIDMTDYQGRQFEIYMGYGGSMSIATSNQFFSGKIIDSKIVGFKIKLMVRGKGQLRDKPIGTRVPGSVHEKFKGRIYPIVYGDHTDPYAYIPVVLNRPIDKYPDFVIDTQPLHTFQDLRVFDEDAQQDYRAKMVDNDGVVINSDKNTVSLIEDTGDTLSFSIGDLSGEIRTSGLGLYNKWEQTFTAKMLVVKIDDELMLVIKVINFEGTTTAAVERGFLGSARAEHAGGSAVYVYSDDLSRFAVLVSNIFWASGMSGMRSSTYPPVLSDLVLSKKIFQVPAQGSYDEIIDTDLATFAKFEGAITASGSYPLPGDPRFTASFKMNLLFNKIGVEGTVVNAYLILKAWHDVTQNPDYPSEDYYWIKVTASVGMTRNYNYTNNGATFKVILHNLNGGREPFNPYGTSGTGWVLVQRVVGGNEPDLNDPFVGTPTAGINFTGDVSYGARKGYGIHKLYIYRNDDNTLQLINDLTVTYPTLNDDETIDNISDTSKEEDYELTGDLKPADISSLNDGGYALSCNTELTPAGILLMNINLYQIGIRCDFYVSPIKYDFYARVKGRKNPGGYFNGGGGDLMENPSSVIEDLCRTSVLDMVAGDLDEVSFDAVYASRAAWKVACDFH